MTATWLQGLLCLAALWELSHNMRLTRFVVQEFLQAVVRLDLLAVRLVRRVFKPRYELVGACQRRGDCCTQIVAEPPRALSRRPAVLRAFVALHRVLHNFHLTGRGPQGELVFRCGFLQTDGKCGIYRYRPRLCRTYPLLPFFTAPKLLPGCGYRIKRRGMGQHARLPVVDANVATYHPTPPTRPNDGALEHASDFVLVDVSPRESARGSRPR